MDIKKLIYLMVLGIFLINLTSAWYNDTFSNSLEAENISLTGTENITRWLEIPSDVSLITSAEMNLSINSVLENGTFQSPTFVSSATTDQAVYGMMIEVNQDFMINRVYSPYGVTQNNPSHVYLYLLNFDVMNGTQIKKATLSNDTEFLWGDLDVELTAGNTYLLGVAKETALYNSYQDVNNNSLQYPYESGDGIFNINNSGWVWFHIANQFVRGYDYNDWATIWNFTYNYTNSFNPRIEVGNTEIWRYENASGGEVNATGNFQAILNDYLTATYLDGDYYRIPFNFSSTGSGTVEYFDMGFSNTGHILNSVTYNNQTYEGKNEEFILNISIDPNLYVTEEVDLIYNGVTYSTTRETEGTFNRIFTTNFDTPTVTNSSEVKMFYWQMELYFSNDSLAVDWACLFEGCNQTVINLNVSECDTTLTDVILNLSLKDEETNTLINNTALDSSIEIDLDIYSMISESVVYEYSEQFSNTNNVTICITPEVLNDTSYYIDYTISYNADNHINEFHYLDKGTLDNSTSFNSLTSKNIDLMDLLTADSTSFLFNYFDEDGLAVDDIIVHVFRKYVGEGLFREVERARQNDDGDTVVHLVEEDVIYYFVISQNGTVLFTSNTYTALCQDTPCQIQLEESGGFQEFDSDWDLVDNGAYTIVTNSADRSVNLTYSLNTPSTMNLTVYKLVNDGSYQAIGSKQALGSTGSLTVTVPISSGNTTFFGSVYQDGVFLKSYWIDFEDDAGIYFGNTMSLFLGALIILTLGLLAVSEGALTIVFIMLGMLVAMILGLVDYRTSTGLNVLIYLVVAGGLIIWKLTKRNR